MTQSIFRQRSKRGVALAMTALLALPASMLAQSPTAAAGAPTSGQSLKILPLVGNNGVNDMERQVMTPLAVQILDRNDLPVEGATVIFRFPINGASATFADSQTSQTVRTNTNGQARATGWAANKQAGTFIIQVTATRGLEQGLGTITMTNIARVLPEQQKAGKRWWTSKWAKIAMVAAGAGITTALVLKNRGPGAVTITGGPGAPTIGGPQ